MAKCLNCDNTTNFNTWCTISKVLEIELNSEERLCDVIGEPEDESLQDEEQYWVLGEDLDFALVSCAWCGSRNVISEKPITGSIKKSK